MNNRQQPFTGIFNSVGSALDNTFGMLESMRKGKLSRAELREWYEKQRKAVQEPLGTAYEAGADYLGRMMPATRGRRAISRRRRSALRSKRSLKNSRSMKRGRTAAMSGATRAVRGVAAMARSASARRDGSSRRSGSRSRS